MVDLEQAAIERLKMASDMSLRRYKQPLVITYSGGKDSDVLLHLAGAAGIPYEVLHSLKMHPECNAVSSFLWDYVDPDEGMTADEFLDACSEVCRTFVCPDCEHFDAEGASDGDYCKEERSLCIHKLYELAQKYYLSRQRRTEWGWIEWRLVPIGDRG